MDTTLDEGGVAPQDSTGTFGRRQRPKGFQVHANRWRVFRMLLGYGILTILTLGIYRFWAKTKLRRYLWNTVEYAGDRLEYHGTVKELFLGFLIALAVLLPLGILNGFVQTYLAADPGNEVLLGIYSFVFAVALLFLINFAVYRMRRYQLTRTTWRSVRFGLDGSAAEYSFHSLLWMLLVGITFGIAYPWMQAWQSRRMINNARMGDARFTCDVSGWTLFKRYIVFALIVIAAVIVTSVMGAFSSPTLGRFSWTDSIVPLCFFGAMMVGYVYLRVGVLRTTMNHMKLANHNIRGRFEAGPILLSFILAFVLIAAGGGLLVSLFFFTPIAGTLLAGAAGMFDGSGGAQSMALVMIVYLIMLPMLLLIGVFANAVLMSVVGISALETVLNGTTLDHSEELESIMQNSDKGPRFGEGFADALDVGAF